MTPFLALLCLLPAAWPQGPIALGQVRSESGRPIAEATVRFVPEPTHGMAWRSWLDPLPEPVAARTDRQGRFRFVAPAGPGSLLVEHRDGLGCFEPRTSTQVPVPLEVRALGSLMTSDGATISASIRALRPGRPSVWLGVRTGAELRLPAGSYLLLLERDGHRVERRVRVSPGRRQELVPPTAAGPPVRVPAGARVVLGRWPGIEARGADGRLPVLAGPDVVRALVPSGPDRDTVLEAWSDNLTGGGIGDPERLSWRPVRVLDLEGLPVSDGTVLTVRDDPGGPRVLARSRFRAGDAEVGVPGDSQGPAAGRVFAVVLADGREPAVVDAAHLPVSVILRPARPATLRVEGPDGDAIVGATVEVRFPGPSLLDRVLTTDGRGQVRIPHADIDGEPPSVSISSPHYLPCEVRVELGANGRVPVVRLEPGLLVQGVAWLAPDRRAAGIEVELRDTTGTLGLTDRVTVTAGDGSFRFRGLPDGIYTLSAHGLVEGFTWSGEVRGVQPGPDEWRLDLRNEDPEPPGGRRGIGR